MSESPSSGADDVGLRASSSSPSVSDDAADIEQEMAVEQLTEQMKYEDDEDLFNAADYEPVYEALRPLSPDLPMDGAERPSPPLASMLPDEYRNVDPRLFFPEFRRDRVLRFSRLFGQAKAASLPQIWRGAKSSKRRALSRSDSQPTATDSAAPEPKRFRLDLASPPPPERCQVDDLVLLQKPLQVAAEARVEPASKSGVKSEPASDVAPWRYGPARLWYDRMGVPPSGEAFDYGIKIKKERPPVEPEPDDDFPPSAYLPISWRHWEDDVILDSEDARQAVIDKFSRGIQPICGWIATQHTRTYESFMAALKSGALAQMFEKGNPKPPMPKNLLLSDVEASGAPSSSQSIFPMDNLDLMYRRWEDDVILDTEAMTKIPEPKLLTLDLWDDANLFGMPADALADGDVDGAPLSPNKGFDRKDHQFTKKSHKILGAVQQRRKQMEEEEVEASAAQLTDKDPFNLSNDEHYLPRGLTQQLSSVGATTLQHSIPAQNIRRPFFPTNLTSRELRHLHRTPWRAFRSRSKAGALPVRSLERYASNKAQQREKQREEQGGGEMFFMREPDDLSAKDGELVVVEFSEEHPPLVQQVGMCSKIRNYYKRKAGRENEPAFDFGETAFTHTSPFLGSLAPGESLQSLENNLSRAPIVRHAPPANDFLLIRTKVGFFLRSMPALFCAGQLCPLIEVPSPNSKRASVFVRDFLLAFIYRLFWESGTTPRRLRMEDIREAFPHYAESSIRKRLKQCADFKRLGPGTELNFWVLRDDFRLPSREEVQAMITPEMCCAQYCMLAAEQRLKDAGYGEKVLFAPEDDDEHVTMEDEIKCAPWNTTRAFIAAVKGKCLLDQSGVADPTGCGEGFSYVRVSSKPPKVWLTRGGLVERATVQEDMPSVPKRLVTGTDADLRKLPLKDAKQMLREFGVKEDEINALTRWEIIDVIRTLSTQQAKNKSDFSGTGMSKFARGNIRFNLAEMQQRYRRESQRIFELQNKVLRNEEEASTDEENSDDESDMEEMGKDIESILKDPRRAPRDAELESEEAERAELQKMLRGEPAGGQSASTSSATGAAPLGKHTKLKIYRTKTAPDGQSFVVVEVVSRPQLIEAYVKIRRTRDDAFIKHFAQMDEQFKEERRKEKRRLQDRLRRLRRNELKVGDGRSPLGGPSGRASPPPPPPPTKASLLKMRCSACGDFGHMKTNKHCRLYGQVVTSESPTLQVAATDEQIEREFEVPSGELVSVEGTKVKLSRALVEQASKMKRRALKLHIPKTLIGKPADGRMAAGGHARVKAVASTAADGDYLLARKQSVQRRRADPRVSMAAQLGTIVNEVRAMAGAAHFLKPVNKKAVPDYYRLVQRPMDLQTIRVNISANAYETREAFLSDMRQVLDNSRLYNGDANEITAAARQLFELASLRVAEKEQKLMRLEKAINPLLDDDDVVAFSYILSGVVQQCKNLPKSVAFHLPVDARKVKSYYERITCPMDLGTMERQLKLHKYRRVAAFLQDVQQIYANSETFNGPQSVYTAKAREIYELAVALVQQNEGALANLEANIERKQMESAETESLMASSVGDAAEEGRAETPIGDAAADDTLPYGSDAAPGALLQADLHLSGDDAADTMPFEGADGGAEVDFSELQRQLAAETAAAADDDDELAEYDPVAELLSASSMQRSGQLHADLALSDSGSSDSEAPGVAAAADCADDF